MIIKKPLCKQKKEITYFLLIVIMFLQLIRITYSENQREYLHSDETWSYGYANSYYDPYMYLIDVDRPYLVGVPTQNVNEWVEGAKFKDYIVVNKGEEFAFDSVISNLRGDMHPYLHDLLLHFICSFFPGKYSRWYSYAINVIAFILTQLGLFDLAKRLFKKEYLALAVCTYYGFCAAAVNTFIYLRSYAILTAITVALVDVLYTMYQKQYVNIKYQLLFAFALTALGSLTHYYFYIFAFIYTLLTCIYLLFSKKMKIMLVFGCSMFAGVVASLILNPWTLVNVLGVTFSDVWNSIVRYGFDFSKLKISIQGSGHSIKFPYYWDLSTCFSLILVETIGIIWNVNRVTFAWVAVILSWLFIMTPLLAFLFRNEVWYKKILIEAKKVILEWKKYLNRIWLSINWGIAIPFISSVLFTMTIPKISSVEDMKLFTDRYLFNIMPIVLISFLSGIFYIVFRIVKKTKYSYILCGFILIVGLVYCNLKAPTHYIFNDGVEGPSLLEITKDCNVIVVTAEAWSMQWYAGELYEANKFFVVEGKNIEVDLPTINELEAESKDTYLIIEKEAEFIDNEIVAGLSVVYDNSESDLMTEEEMTRELKEKVGWIKDLEFVQERESFRGNLEVFKIVYK